MTSHRMYCHLIANEGLDVFTISDYLVYACKAVRYSIKGVIKLLRIKINKTI